MEGRSSSLLAAAQRKARPEKVRGAAAGHSAYMAAACNEGHCCSGCKLVAVVTEIYMPSHARDANEVSAIKNQCCSRRNIGLSSDSCQASCRAKGSTAHSAECSTCVRADKASWKAALQDAEAILARCVSECGAGAELLEGKDAELAAFALAYASSAEDRERLLLQVRQSLQQVGIFWCMPFSSFHNAQTRQPSQHVEASEA